MRFKRGVGPTVLALGVAGGLAATSALAENNGVYDLGEIHVYAPAPTKQTFDSYGGSTLSNQIIETYNKESLDKAITLIPGASSAPTGNQRNETNIFIHGFDRWQVPLSIDGVPIYLPADNRLDFSRFMTNDISEVQVAKGYVSVLDGPGGMGGWVNLVTRTPSKPAEAETRLEADFGNGAFDGFRVYSRAGMRLDHFYIQASGSYRRLDGWELSDSFAPTKNENGGRRDWSAARDRGVNFKVGYTPNASDEYSISFLRQEGAKNAPYNVDPSAQNRYWTWPWWNVQTLALATRTALGPDAYVKSRVYWETFDNAIDMYDDPAQTKQFSASNAQHSEYSDYALGGSLEVGKDFGALDTLKGAVFYRRDNHSEQNQYFVDQFGLNQASTPKSKTCATSTTNFLPCFLEPRQVDVEDTYSVALENTYHLGPAVDLIGGASYDYRKIGQAEDYVLGTVAKGVYYSPYWVNYGSTASQAFNAQGGVVWRYSDTSKLFANISDRTRFPTLFELYSTRFGTAASNPGLLPERAVNYQVGWTTAYAPGSQFSALVYYANVSNLIQSVPTGGVYVDPISGAKSNVTQNQNVGDGYRYGIDLAVDHSVNDSLTVGGNVSAIRSVVTNPSVPGFQLTGFPSVKGFAYANWLPIPNLTISPSLELADANWTSKTISGVTTYFRTGAYALANISAEFRFDAHLSLTAGVRNIFDQNYTPVWGYPAQGRNYYMVAKATF